MMKHIYKLLFFKRIDGNLESYSHKTVPISKTEALKRGRLLAKTNNSRFVSATVINNG